MAAIMGELGSELGGYGLLAVAVDVGLTLGLIVAALTIGIWLSHHPQGRPVGQLRTAVVNPQKTRRRTSGRQPGRLDFSRDFPREHPQDPT